MIEILTPTPREVYVQGAETAVATNGNKYYRLKLLHIAEDGGLRELSGICFNAGVNPEVGGIYEPVGRVENFRGKQQFKVEELRRIQGDTSRYIKSTQLDTEHMFSTLKTHTRNFGILTQLLDEQLFDNPEVLERFKTWPAARGMHHAFKGGLLEHTYLMFETARNLLAADPICASIDPGVILTSIVLHDLGKTVEMDFVAGTEANYSNAGLMLGHISIMDSQIASFISRNCPAAVTSQKVAVERLFMVRHCVLSHHGKLEWGSPVKPATIEAVFLHQLDMLQARLQMAAEALSSVAVGSRTAYSKGLETDLLKWR